MKEQLKKVSSLIEKIDDFKNIDDYSLLENKIKEELSDILLDTPKDIFVTAINLKVLKPIQEKIKIAIHFTETKRSRGFRSERLKILSKKDFLINLRNQILIDYREQLKGLELYKEFLIEKANSRFLILNPTQDYPIEIFTTKQFENILNKASSRVISYFEKQLIAKQSTYKEELFFFDSRIYKCLKEKENEIEKINQILIHKEKEQKKNIESLSSTEQIYFYSPPSKRRNLASTIQVDRINFIDYLLENEINFDNSNELDILMKHKAALQKLQKRLHNTHLFLKLNKPKKQIPLTVFNDRDFNKLETLYYELEYFLDKSTQLDEVLNVFTLNYEPTLKINLRNGTTNDFAYLINKLQPFFMADIAHRNNYNQWWADRFTFNEVEKTKKAISTMRSNTKKGGIRQQAETTRINSIVDVLK